MIMDEKEVSQDELLNKGWIKSWMMFEVQASQRDAAISALKKHLDSLNHEAGIVIAEENISNINELEAPEHIKSQGINILYSQVTEVILFAESFEVIVNATINYAPTAVEITAPKEIVLSMRDAQGALASVADMMHKYAAAGLGGMLIKS